MILVVWPFAKLPKLNEAFHGIKFPHPCTITSHAFQRQYNHHEKISEEKPNFRCIY